MALRIRRGAAREAASPNAGMRLQGGVARGAGELAFQRTIREALRRWIERTGAAAAKAFAALNQRLGELRRLEWALEAALQVEVAKAARVRARLEVSVVTVVAVLVSGALGTATAWPFFEGQGWPLPLVVLAAIGVAAVEIALAAATGAMVYALVLDEYRSVFELTPKQRTWTLSSMIGFGTLTATLVVALGLLRGEGWDQALWIALGAAAASLGAYTGAAMYESRHHLRAEALRKRLDRTKAAADAVCDTHAAISRATMARGRTHRALAADLGHTGQLTFETVWRRHHRDPRAVVPELPALVLPSDRELERMLLVALREPQRQAPRHGPAGPSMPPYPANGNGNGAVHHGVPS
ncbi:MAG TPA: hypothetical protein VKB25_05270 [Conexibacter sp.]|nr:hypothetical protein [Conexibacter sp.]